MMTAIAMSMGEWVNLLVSLTIFAYLIHKL